MTRPALRATLVTVAVVVGQLAWILTLPPFRGIDEFDHAFRAAGVAHGQLLPSDRPVENGRGWYVEAPADLVRAAAPVCRSYSYTGRDNCTASGAADDGYVEVASGAARYNPVFYWLVGTPARAFGGARKVYALRVAGSLLCAALVWLASYALATGFRTAWPLLAGAVAMTPMFVYSTALGAPNGVEMAAGLVVAASAAALGGGRLTLRQEGGLLLAAALAAATLLSARTLGPLWLTLLLAAVLPWLGARPLLALLRRHRPSATAGAALVTAAATGALAWARLAAPNAVSAEPDLHLAHPLARSLADLPLWVLQSVAAFPTRNEPAPTAVYAAALAALGGLLAILMRAVPGRVRLLVGGLVAVWLAVQVAVSAATYSHLGPVWQGRYALPFAVAIPVLLAAAADRAGVTAPGRRSVVLVVGLLATAHGWATVQVLRSELATSPLAGSPAWWHATVPVLVALALAGAALLAVAAHQAPHRIIDTAPGPRPQEVPA